MKQNKICNVPSSLWEKPHLPAEMYLKTQAEKQCSELQLFIYFTCKGSLQNIYSAK